MTGLDSLIILTEKANNLVLKLIEGIDYSIWNTVPNGQKSNVIWQIGHLAISQNYHAIMVITGLKPELKEIPLKLFFENFGMGSNPSNVSNDITPEFVKTSFIKIGKVALNGYSNLQENDLEANLEPTRVPHPIAKVKHEAMMWNIQHLHWHCGQIAMLRISLGLKGGFTKN